MLVGDGRGRPVGQADPAFDEGRGREVKRMVLWVLIGVVVLVASVFVIGSFMPVRYEGATVVAFDRDVQAVWDALQDVRAHPMTGRMMKSIEDLPAAPTGPVWTEDMGHGEVITVTTEVSEAPRRMVRHMTSGATAMESRWEYALEPAGDGCRVTLSGVTDIAKGTWHTPVFRVMMAIGGGVKKGLDIQLAMVAATLDG